MNLDFDLDDPQETEFLVAIGNRNEPDLNHIHIHPDVEKEFEKMTESTWRAMHQEHNQPNLYDPANDFSGPTFVYMPLEDERVSRPRYLYSYGTARQLNNPLEMFAKTSLYCARISDGSGRKILGVKQASGLGRRLYKPGRVRLVPAGLELADEPEFQIAREFDFLIDSTNVFIYKQRAFEGVSRLSSFILEAVPENLDYVKCQMDYVDFSNLERFS